jgi:WD40 repeat protein
VTASKDGTARLWSLIEGKELRSLAGHEGPVQFAAFSPDGSQVVTAGIDRTARTWDSTTGKELFHVTGHDDLLYSAVFSPDGKWILTASADLSARIWVADFADLLAQAQALIQRAPPIFTPEERRRYGFDE